MADGSLRRELAHEWSVPWVEGDAEPSSDVMVNRAMTSLHGFDMASSNPERPSLIHHGPPGVYYRTLDDIRVGLVEWRAECVDYDSDPEGWRVARLALARAVIEEERRFGVLGAEARRGAERQDRFSAVRLLAAEHASEPFPDCRGEEIDGVDLVLVDADLHGCVLHFLGRSFGLDAWQRNILERVSDDLDRVQQKLPSACVAYFQQSQALAHSLLAALDDEGAGSRG